MCGLAGFVDLKARYDADQLASIASAMSTALYHRGPDDGGVWVDSEVGIALGHRRLAVIDLSQDGRQPMISHHGRYVIVFNGEIYNFQRIRRNLEARGRNFTGKSDTEVVLASIEEHGLWESLKSFVGMFAFALWDRKERLLHLVRDRIGEKPLYYGVVGDAFVFGSELKALRKHPEWSGEIQREALELFLRHGYVPAPYSIYKHIRKLGPGTVLSLSVVGGTPRYKLQPYWSPKAAVSLGDDAAPVTDAEAVDRLDLFLRETILEKMASDVPLGAFLSGGIDSTTVAALMQSQSERSIRTFTVGFNEKGFDEAASARRVAEYLGTDHTEMYVSPREAQDVIPKLPLIFDEPFADSSQIPTCLLSSMAKRHVTVALSGDGGDELFGGYNRYVWTERLWSSIDRVPRALRSVANVALRSVPIGVTDFVFDVFKPLIPRALRFNNAGYKLNKVARLFATSQPSDLYVSLISHWDLPAELVVDPEGSGGKVETQYDLVSDDLLKCMTYWDITGYLPDDILVKVDRSSMAVALEARSPFLDHRLVEYAFSLPRSMKIRNGVGKWLLRQVLYRYVPPSLVERPKMGFGVPIGEWLRDPLKAWAEELIDEKRLNAEGYLRPKVIREHWQAHCSRRQNWEYRLWNVLMFQSWLEANRSSSQTSQ